jgi:hypothetical protein
MELDRFYPTQCFLILNGIRFGSTSTRLQICDLNSMQQKPSSKIIQIFFSLSRNLQNFMKPAIHYQAHKTPLFISALRNINPDHAPLIYSFKVNLGTSAKRRRATIRLTMSVCLSIRPSVRQSARVYEVPMDEFPEI